MKRAARVYPARPAVVHGDRVITFAEKYDRVRRFAGALAGFGAGRGDTVAVLAPNVPALLEAHYAVPLAGAVLNALNTRLDAAGIAFILEHSETKVLLVDRELTATARAALDHVRRPITVIDIADPALPPTPTLGAVEYEDWPAPAARARQSARQGVGMTALEDWGVIDPESGAPAPADGETIGEVVLRGNTVMKGYLKNPKATAEALKDGWFRTGDLGVLHPDGYVEIKDRAKDIIISGGENISSLEVEEALADMGLSLSDAVRVFFRGG